MLTNVDIEFYIYRLFALCGFLNDLYIKTKLHVRKLKLHSGENTGILSYTDITDTYVLAMPTVAVNGVDYTANVIDQPERFHILEWRSCTADNEIVLTEFIAQSFGVSIGDTVTVRGDIGSGEYIVSGIESCIL